jgi:hypothetical protein
MSIAAAARPSKHVAVTAIGVITLLWGAAHAVLGGWLVWVGYVCFAVLGRPADPRDPWAQGFAPLVQFFALIGGMICTALGVVSLLQGVSGLVAGWGVLGRKPWGHIPTCILAGLALPWGLLLLWLGASDSATYVALGAAEILYGLLAVVILIKYGREFSWPGV